MQPELVSLNDLDGKRLFMFVQDPMAMPFFNSEAIAAGLPYRATSLGDVTGKETGLELVKAANEHEAWWAAIVERDRQWLAAHPDYVPPTRSANE